MLRCGTSKEHQGDAASHGGSNRCRDLNRGSECASREEKAFAGFGDGMGSGSEPGGASGTVRGICGEDLAEDRIGDEAGVRAVE